LHLALEGTNNKQRKQTNEEMAMVATGNNNNMGGEGRNKANNC
jgi:hypothetical protein